MEKCATKFNWIHHCLQKVPNKYVINTVYPLLNWTWIHDGTLWILVVSTEGFIQFNHDYHLPSGDCKIISIVKCITISEMLKYASKKGVHCLSFLLFFLRIDSMRHFLKSMLARNITMNLEFKAIKVSKSQFPSISRL